MGEMEDKLLDDLMTSSPVLLEAAIPPTYLSLVPPKPLICNYCYLGEQIAAASLCLRLSAIYTVAHDEFAARRIFKCDSNTGRLRLITYFATEEQLLLNAVLG